MIIGHEPYSYDFVLNTAFRSLTGAVGAKKTHKSLYETMKTTKLITALAMLGMVACNNAPEEAGVNSTTPLRLTVGMRTKALVTETTLPDASQIGTFLLEDEGALYDALPYSNIPFTATGIAEAQTWAATSDVMLSATQGTLYAYYPYASETAQVSSVAVAATSDHQVDYMWATPVDGLDNRNATASLEMNHALTAVRLKVTKGDYSGEGLITEASVSSSALATAATMNAADGTLSGVTGAGEVIAPALTQFVLSASEQNVEFIAVPVADAEEALVIKMVVDGVTLAVTAPATEYPQGMIAEYELAVNNTGMSLVKVTVKEWSKANKGSLGISQVEQ